MKLLKLITIAAVLFVNIGVAFSSEKTNVEKASTTDQKVNFILIYTDDHGYSDLSCQGVQDDVRTPNIDKLAMNGVRMESGYSTAPQCVPSRGGVMVGRHQSKFSLELNKDPLTGFNKEVTIAERLKKAGYATGMTGKWHLGKKEEITSHGFDQVYYKNGINTGFTNFNLQGEIIPWTKQTNEDYHLDVNTEAACTFINMHKDTPFFFYLAYRAPHVPLDATQKYLDRFPGEMPERRRQALAMLSAVDDGVGRVLKTLEDNHLTENTVIFFIGDNGAPLKITKKDKPGGGPGWDGSLNDPLNGEKGTLIEGGIRTPYVVYWKGKLKKGVYKHPVSALDFAATANALAGLPDDDMLDGVNLIPYLNGEKEDAPHESLCWRWGAQAAIRKGNWKFLIGGDREYLFDLDKDVEEKVDLLEQYPDVAAQLKLELSEWCDGLSPKGLAKGSMTKNANIYYDFYLDDIPYSTIRLQQKGK